MDTTMLVITALVLAVLLILVGVIYNRAIRLRVLVREGFSGIDVQLKRRHNLIPNLVRTAQAAANFEQNVLTDIARLRTQAMREPDNGNPSIDGKQRDENALTGALVNFFAVAENYPTLQSSTNFLKLQRELSEIEDFLQKARRYYNGTVRNYNTQLQIFPSNLITALFRFQKADFFQIEHSLQRAVPKVQLQPPTKG
tara:strand:- start:207 stop:800 length:594 start_codon:yes stop_codon:yes gene_type:complete